MSGDFDGTEPIPGLPGLLPPGEHILWQGAPDWRKLAVNVFHVRAVSFYFAALALLGVAQGYRVGAGMTLAAGVACLGVLALLAWSSARTSMYTLTNRRIVMRIGIALPISFNLPLSKVKAVDVRLLGDGKGDVALSLTDDAKLGYALLWPHARPWRVRNPEPMLRAAPDIQTLAARLARACEGETAAPALVSTVERPLEVAA